MHVCGQVTCAGQVYTPAILKQPSITSWLERVCYHLLWSHNMHLARVTCLMCKPLLKAIIREVGVTSALATGQHSRAVAIFSWINLECPVAPRRCGPKLSRSLHNSPVIAAGCNKAFWLSWYSAMAAPAVAAWKPGDDNIQTSNQSSVVPVPSGCQVPT